jgi:hypothetical protein
MEDLLQDRQPLVIRVPVLRLVAMGGSVLLFPSAPAAFVRHAARAILSRIFSSLPNNSNLHLPQSRCGARRLAP